MDAGSRLSFQNRFISMQSGYSPPSSKAMAFPIVAFALVLTTLVLYTTGNSNSDSVITLLSISLFLLFGSLMYAYMPAGGAMAGTGSTNWKGILLAFAAAAVSMLAILLIVHYTIRPIFKIRNAGPGFIPVPTVDKQSTGEYWTTTPAILNSTDTILLGSDDGTYNYSLALDILIKDPNISSTMDRPIFSRSDVKFTGRPVVSEGVTIAQQIGNYNLAMYMDKSTNDLIVSTISVVDGKQLYENSVIANVPVQQPFRIGVVLGSKYMEVYYNGKLHSTRQLAGSPLPVAGAFIPPGNAFAAMADVRNLRLWKGAITPAEMAYLPALDISNFGDITQRSLSAISELIGGVCGGGGGGGNSSNGSSPTSGPGVSNTVLTEVQSNIGDYVRAIGGSQMVMPAAASVVASAMPPSTPPTVPASASLLAAPAIPSIPASASLPLPPSIPASASLPLPPSTPPTVPASASLLAAPAIPAIPASASLPLPPSAIPAIPASASLLAAPSLPASASASA